jgi:hypothetical protein
VPIVYSYYNPLPAMDVGTEAGLIRLWQKSWRACEFLPVMLTHQMAEAHPRAKEFLAVVSKFPSTNPAGYDLACWMRWLALAQAGGGLMTDYDVIARAFSPEFLALPNDVTVLDRGGVPCAVHTTPEGAHQIVNDIKYPHFIENDGTHYSDMIAFQAIGYPKAPSLTAPYGAPDWKDAPAVHFSHSDCHRENPKLKRSDVIRKEMNLTA